MYRACNQVLRAPAPLYSPSAVHPQCPIYTPTFQCIMQLHHTLLYPHTPHMPTSSYTANALAHCLCPQLPHSPSALLHPLCPILCLYTPHSMSCTPLCCGAQHLHLIHIPYTCLHPLHPHPQLPCIPPTPSSISRCVQFAIHVWYSSNVS